MKSILLPVLILGFSVSTGCAATATPVTLNTVGPAPELQTPADQSPTGVLMVFSAYETNSLGASPFDDLHPHTEYKIYREDGTLIQKVANRTGAFGEDPAAVKLAPGVYRVVARSNGSGLVTVPVRVVDRKVTRVHLDSSAAGANPKDAHLVRLPDGQVVGWSADAE